MQVRFSSTETQSRWSAIVLNVRRIPDVLTVEETQTCYSALSIKERTIVLMAVGTGLRRSELFALKWKDVDFVAKHLSVIRSIVSRSSAICRRKRRKNPCLFTNLWLRLCWNGVDILPSRKREDWVFASPHSDGKRPYWRKRS